MHCLFYYAPFVDICISFFILHWLISLLYNCFTYYLVVQFNCSILFSLISYICEAAFLALLSIRIAYKYVFINIFTMIRSSDANICMGHFLCNTIFNLLTDTCSIEPHTNQSSLLILTQIYTEISSTIYTTLNMIFTNSIL